MNGAINFLEPEIRSEFQVTVERKKLWKCELDMIQLIEKLCKQNGLSFFLIYGSALGAERHNGFIPWDDDLDVGMLREDFDRLRVLLSKELQDPYYVEYGLLKDGRFSPLMRIRDRRTTGTTYEEYLYGTMGGAFVEIYPLDDVPAGTKAEKRQMWISRLLFLLLYYRSRTDEFSSLKKIALRIGKMLPAEWLFSRYEANSRKYLHKGNDGYVNAVALPVYGQEGALRIRKDAAKDTVFHPYEYIELPILRTNRQLMRQSYGDYMQLPPVEDRGMNHDKVVYYNPDVPCDSERAREETKRYFQS